MPIASLRALYFTYFASAGLLMTFGPWHFEAVGLDAAAIGAVFAARTALSLVAQPFYGRVDDRWGRPVALLRRVLVAALAASVLLPLSTTATSVVVAVLLVALFECAVVPVSDALTLRTVGPARYGGVRMWGSLGYGVAVALVGWLAVGRSASEVGFASLVAYVALALLTLASAMALQPAPRERALAGPDAAAVRATSALALDAIPWTRPLVFFLLAGACHWVAITAFNIFYSLRVAEAGHDASVVGAGVLVAVAAEALTFGWAGRLFRRVDEARWLIPAFLVGTLRWWLVAECTTAWALIALQLLHSAGFGLWFAASLGVLPRLGPASRRSSLQAIFSALVLSGGGIAGGLLLGRLASAYDYAAAFRAAAVFEVLAIVMVVLAGPSLRRAPETAA